jgi:hypothetical protein
MYKKNTGIVLMMYNSTLVTKNKLLCYVRYISPALSLAFLTFGVPQDRSIIINGPMYITAVRCDD